MIEIFQTFGSGLTGALGAPMLPLLPALVAWAVAAPRASYVPAGFAASFALGFALLNGGAGWLVDNADPGAVVAGLAIAAYGLNAMGALRMPFANAAAPFLGFAFAFGWAPMPSAALAEAVDSGFAATAAYGAGLAAFAWLANPFLSRVSRRIFSREPVFAKLAGMTLFATGLAIAAGLFAELGFALDATFPALRNLG